MVVLRSSMHGEAELEVAHGLIGRDVVCSLLSLGSLPHLTCSLHEPSRFSGCHLLPGLVTFYENAYLDRGAIDELAVGGSWTRTRNVL